MTRPTNIERLPKWAQAYIEKLERDNVELRSGLDALRDAREPGPIRLGSVSHELLSTYPNRVKTADRPFYIPGNDVVVEFAGVHLKVLCASGGPDPVRDELRLYFGPLRPQHSDRVTIAPHAANAVRLEPMPYADSTIEQAKARRLT